MKKKTDVEIAVGIIRLWQEWASIGKVLGSDDPWPSVGKQAELYGMLRLYVNHGIIDSFVINGIVWKDNEIGDVGKAITGHISVSEFERRYG